MDLNTLKAALYDLRGCIHRGLTPTHPLIHINISCYWNNNTRILSLNIHHSNSHTHKLNLNLKVFKWSLVWSHSGRHPVPLNWNENVKRFKASTSTCLIAAYTVVAVENTNIKYSDTSGVSQSHHIIHAISQFSDRVRVWWSSRLTDIWIKSHVSYLQNG